MASRGSKAQLVRFIAEYHTRLMYKGALSRGALFFERRAQRASLEAELSKLSRTELMPMARHAELVMGKLSAGAPAKPLTEQDIEFLDAVLRKALKVGSVRNACRIIAGEKRASALEKRFRDIRKRQDATAVELQG
jgi:hypothetical protein